MIFCSFKSKSIIKRSFPFFNIQLVVKKSLITSWTSSFLSGNFEKSAMLHNSDPSSHHWKSVTFPRGKVPTPSNLYFNIILQPCLHSALAVAWTYLTSSKTSRNKQINAACQDLKNLQNWPLVREKLTVGCQQHSFSVYVIFTVPINSSLKIERIKPSHSLIMSSGTSKLPKTEENKASCRPEIKEKYGDGHVRSAIIAHNKCMS